MTIATPMLDASCLPLYEWLDVPVWVFDAVHMRNAWANEAARAYWHASSREELLARDYSDASEGARRRLALAMQAHARGEVLREAWTLYPKGVPVTSNLVSRGILLADGTQALLFAAERLPATIDPDTLRGVDAVQHTAVRIALHDLPGGGVLMRNPAAMLAFGPVRTDAGDPRSDFASMFTEPEVAKRIIAQVLDGQVFGAEFELQTLQGPRWHAVDVRPVLDPVSGLRAMQFNARDIGELKAVQQALENARNAADAANTAKSAFLANMSHEIRTPMNGVLGLTELVLQMELGDKQRQFIALAHQSAQGLMVIINDLLDVTKIEAGKLVLETHPFSIRPCIAQALSPLVPTASVKNIRLNWHVADTVPERAIGDAARLRQVLINLIGNAVKFTSTGEVRVEVEPVAAPTMNGAASKADTMALRFSVHDTGIGMQPEHLPRVFEPFMQADTSITRRYGGTGLGLTIVARLVELMGGEVHVTSTPGVGSCFSFTAQLERA